MGDEEKRPRWTPRRVVRWTGTTAITTSALMAIFGAYKVGTNVSPRVFYVYWTIFFFFLMGAIALAMVDGMITIVKFRKDHIELKRITRQAVQNDKNANQ